MEPEIVYYECFNSISNGENKDIRNPSSRFIAGKVKSENVVLTRYPHCPPGRDGVREPGPQHGQSHLGARAEPNAATHRKADPEEKHKPVASNPSTPPHGEGHAVEVELSLPAMERSMGQERGQIGHSSDDSW